MALPPELLARVIAYLDPAEASTALDLCRFSRCSRLLHNVASDQQLWRRLYTHRWRRHRTRAGYLELLLRDNGNSGSSVNWKAEYGQRDLQDRAALQCVRKMVAEPIGRYSEARYILEDAQLGVFDCLLNYQRHLSSDHPFHEQLSEKLWVRELLDALRRSEALQTWHKLLFEESRSEATVACIAAFSGFRGADSVEMQDKFENLASFTRTRLGAEYLKTYPDQIEVSKGICQAMAAKGIRPSTPQSFHRLQNAFLNLVIDNGASTLPMSLVCIFCGIAHRLGLRASIINFPNRILARIEGWKDLEDLPQESFILDIFEYGEVLSESDIMTRLSMIGIPQSSAPNFLHSAAPSEVITRVGRNIIESLTREEGGIVGSNDNSRSAHAAVAALLFVQPMVDALPNILYQFPMDVFSIERDYIPIVQREGVEGFLMADRLRLTQRSILERDAQPIQPRIRAQEIKPEEGDDKEILYHIGTIFRHRRWGYIGVIKRWDPRCCADEVWIQGNNVDALDNGGRHQPFYSISADDGSDRYIAQVNVIPMRSVHPHTLHRLINMHENLGWTFARADPERGIFVMDESHKRKYPEDAQWQQEILSQPGV